VATKCPKCHSENPETKQFCADCGTQLVPSKGPQVSKTLTLETKPEELTRGTVFAGRYEILEELGGGGMGKVYRVYDQKLEEEVALKLIRPEIAVNRTAIERFKNELKVARKIAHKNVCKMYDLGESEGTSYITMEYVRGEDLKSVIHRMGTITMAKAVSIASQVAEGLGEANKLGIIHRDLKPGNIMIDREGNAKIMDFGIARSLKAKGITGEGVSVGTPEYMPPEQVEGKEADQRADIYSLGIILYEMLAGRVPFEGDTPLSIAMKQKNDIPTNLIKLNPQRS
jgi:serine/threonine protein kinase